MAKSDSKSKLSKSGKKPKSVASASRANGQRGARRLMNQKLVDAYQSELNKSLGSDTFSAIFNRLNEDRDVRQEEAIAIAEGLLEATVAPSTARGAALSRILKLHNSLHTFKLKQRAVGGRSAA